MSTESDLNLRSEISYSSSTVFGAERDLCSTTLANTNGSADPIKIYEGYHCDLIKLLNLQQNDHLMKTDQLTKKLSDLQKELICAASKVEHAEVLRQTCELELTKAHVLNKRLDQMHQQKSQLLTEAETRLQKAEEQNKAMREEMLRAHEAEKQEWLQRCTESKQNEEKMTTQIQFLADQLEEQKIQLSEVISEREKLQSQVKKLSRDLELAAQESNKSDLNEDAVREAAIVKQEYETLKKNYELLQDAYEQNEAQLSDMRQRLPVVLHQAVSQGVENIRVVAKQQLEDANTRLMDAENRLAEQFRKLRALEFANSRMEMQNSESPDEIPHLVANATQTELQQPQIVLPLNGNEDNSGAIKPRCDRASILLNPDTARKMQEKLTLVRRQAAQMEMEQRWLYQQLEMFVNAMECTCEQGAGVLACPSSERSKSKSASYKQFNKGTSISTREDEDDRGSRPPSRNFLRVPPPPWRQDSVRIRHTPERIGSPSRQDQQISANWNNKYDDRGSNWQSKDKIGLSTINSKPSDNAYDFWPHLEKLMTRVYRCLEFQQQKLQSAEQTTMRLYKKLSTLETENQSLRKKVQLHEKMRAYYHDENTASVRTRASSTCCAEICQLHRDQKKSHTNSTSKPCKTKDNQLSELQARCTQALSEASRWRRRFKEMENKFKTEHECLQAMKISQQADLRQRERLLFSVCRLVQDASKHIDQAVGKTVSEVNQTAQCIEETADFPKDFLQPNSSAADELEQRHSDCDSACPNCTGGSSKTVAYRDAPDTAPKRSSLSLTACGDGSATCDKHTLPRSTSPAQNFETLGEYDEPTMVEDLEQCLYTNCNNNSEVSKTDTTKSRLSKKFRYKLTRRVIRNKTQDTDDQSAGLEASSTFGQLSKATNNSTIAQHPEDNACVQPLVPSVPSEHSRNVEEGCSRSYSSGLKEKAGESVSSAIDYTLGGAVNTDYSTSISSHEDTTARNSEEVDEWTHLRDAVRYELSRVLTNVIVQAKQQDALANECLDAITQLQAELNSHQNPSSFDPQSAAHQCPTPCGEGKNFIPRKQHYTVAHRTFNQDSSYVSREQSLRSVHPWGASLIPPPSPPLVPALVSQPPVALETQPVKALRQESPNRPSQLFPTSSSFLPSAASAHRSCSLESEEAIKSNKSAESPSKPPPEVKDMPSTGSLHHRSSQVASASMVKQEPEIPRKPSPLMIRRPSLPPRKISTPSQYDAQITVLRANSYPEVMHNPGESSLAAPSVVRLKSSHSEGLEHNFSVSLNGSATRTLSPPVRLETPRPREPVTPPSVESRSPGLEPSTNPSPISTRGASPHKVLSPAGMISPKAHKLSASPTISIHSAASRHHESPPSVGVHSTTSQTTSPPARMKSPKAYKPAVPPSVNAPPVSHRHHKSPPSVGVHSTTSQATSPPARMKSPKAYKPATSPSVNALPVSPKHHESPPSVDMHSSTSQAISSPAKIKLTKTHKLPTSSPSHSRHPSPGRSEHSSLISVKGAEFQTTSPSPQKRTPKTCTPTTSPLVRTQSLPPGNSPRPNSGGLEKSVSPSSSKHNKKREASPARDTVNPHTTNSASLKPIIPGFGLDSPPSPRSTSGPSYTTEVPDPQKSCSPRNPLFNLRQKFPLRKKECSKTSDKPKWLLAGGIVKPTCTTATVMHLCKLKDKCHWRKSADDQVITKSASDNPPTSTHESIPSDVPSVMRRFRTTECLPCIPVRQASESSGMAIMRETKSNLLVPGDTGRQHNENSTYATDKKLTVDLTNRQIWKNDETRGFPANRIKSVINKVPRNKPLHPHCCVVLPPLSNPNGKMRSGSPVTFHHHTSSSEGLTEEYHGQTGLATLLSQIVERAERELVHKEQPDQLLEELMTDGLVSTLSFREC
ncbi:unnamed protein product [Calicophoron daubneyi]|uniref:Uncharacterized protein n=1 Tax=Calicophoron daubneyi TaxID=300641 RepID=A0AAV2TUP8_CALDB